MPPVFPPTHLLTPTARAVRLVCWSLAIACAVTATAVQAAGDTTTSAAQAPVRTYAIAGGPLGTVLGNFAAESSVVLAFDAEQTRGMSSVGLRGNYSVAAGFAQLLAGSGLEASPGAGGRYFLRKLPVSSLTGPAQLRQVTVTGTPDTESVTGHVDGIVATRSATGTKTNTPLIEIPQAISVITRDEMDQRGVQTLNSAVAYTPGVRVIDYPGGQGAPDVYLRGFRSFNLFSSYRDGLRTGFNQYDTDFEMYGLERIDVLKGPASVLFGQIAPGGLINMTSKRPTAERIREIQLQGGNYDNKQAAFDFAGKLDEDGEWLYRATGLLRNSGTQIDGSPDNRTYLAPSLTWRPSADTSVTLMTSYMKTTRGGSEQSLPLSGTVLRNPNGEIPASTNIGDPDVSHYKVVNSSVGYQWDQRMGDGWKFQQNLRFMHTDVDYLSNGARTTALANDRYLNYGYQYRPKNTDTFLLDNNLQREFEGFGLKHQVLVGLDHARYEGSEMRASSVQSGTIDVYNPVYGNSGFTWNRRNVDGKSEVRQTGIYLQDQIKLDRWIATLGARKDWVDNQETDYLTATSSQQKPDAVTGRAGLTYLFDNGLAPYASYATSFQPLAGVSAPQRGSTMFKPTKGRQAEAGLKFQPKGWNSFATMSVFELTQQNVATVDPLYSGNSVQDGEVRSRGIELEGKAYLSEGFSLTASYAYLDSEVTKDNPTLAGVSKVGLTPASVPRNTASAWLDYTVHQGPVQGLGMGLGLRYVGASFNAQNTVRIASYTLLDASVRYDLGRLSPELKGASFAITANNLLDRKYYTPGFYERTVFYGNRRSVIGTLTYRW